MVQRPAGGVGAELPGKSQRLPQAVRLGGLLPRFKDVDDEKEKLGEAPVSTKRGYPSSIHSRTST